MMKSSAASASETSGDGRLSPSNTSDRHQQQPSGVPVEAGPEATTTKDPAASLPPTINDAGTALTFSLSNVHEHLICELCSGYYKEPFTLHECLHTFCKSCIFYSVVACGLRSCPECKSFVGKEIHKFGTADANLDSIIEAIFPEFKAKEDRDCEAFYKNRGIKRKTEESTKERGKKIKSHSHHTAGGCHNKKDDIEFALFPQCLSKGGDKEEELDPLDKPFLRSIGKLKINQLKRYLVSVLPNLQGATEELDILCNGVPVGDEISLGFVKRLLWPHEESILELTYKRK